jgi:hypothetical protein
MISGYTSHSATGQPVALRIRGPPWVIFVRSTPPDALGMSTSLRSRPNRRTAANRREVPIPDSCSAHPPLVQLEHRTQKVLHRCFCSLR